MKDEPTHLLYPSSKHIWTEDRSFLQRVIPTTMRPAHGPLLKQRMASPQAHLQLALAQAALYAETDSETTHLSISLN